MRGGKTDSAGAERFLCVNSPVCEQLIPTGIDLARRRANSLQSISLRASRSCFSAALLLCFSCSSAFRSLTPPRKYAADFAPASSPFPFPSAHFRSLFRCGIPPFVCKQPIPRVLTRCANSLQSISLRASRSCFFAALVLPLLPLRSFV